MNLKKRYITFAAVIALTLGCSNSVLADGSAFTPLNFDDTTYTAPVNSAAKGIAPNASPVAASPTAAELTGNSGIQNAILQLDNAQVDIRNDLLNYKAKYSDVDAQYKLIKNERKMLGKQVKYTEKRIKALDKAKDKIRKNML